MWWVLSGVSFSTGNAPMMALIQTLVPNALQGRVLSLLNTTLGLAGPVGLALGGLLGFASSSVRRLGAQLLEGMNDPGAGIPVPEKAERAG